MTTICNKCGEDMFKHNFWKSLFLGDGCPNTPHIYQSQTLPQLFHKKEAILGPDGEGVIIEWDCEHEQSQCQCYSDYLYNRDNMKLREENDILRQAYTNLKCGFQSSADNSNEKADQIISNYNEHRAKVKEAIKQVIEQNAELLERLAKSDGGDK